MAFNQFKQIQLTLSSSFQLIIFFLFTGGQLDMYSLFEFKHFSPHKSKYKYRTPNTIAVSFNFYHMENFQLPKHKTVYRSYQVITFKL